MNATGAKNVDLDKLASLIGSVLLVPTISAFTDLYLRDHQHVMAGTDSRNLIQTKNYIQILDKLYTAQAEALCHLLDISDTEAKDSYTNSEFLPPKCLS